MRNNDNNNQNHPYKRQYAPIGDEMNRGKTVPGKRTGKEVIIPNGNELFGNDLQEILNAHRNENLLGLYESSSSSSSSKLSITSSDISESVDDDEEEENITASKQTEITKKSLITAVGANIKQDSNNVNNIKSIEEDIKKSVFKETPVKEFKSIKEEKKESSGISSSSSDEEEDAKNNDFFTEVKREHQVINILNF
jgi:hypothetical protein